MEVMIIVWYDYSSGNSGNRVIEVGGDNTFRNDGLIVVKINLMVLMYGVLQDGTLIGWGWFD